VPQAVTEWTRIQKSEISERATATEGSIMIKIVLSVFLCLSVIQNLYAGRSSSDSDMFWRADLHVGTRWLDYDALNSQLGSLGYPTLNNRNTLFGFTIGSSDRMGGGGFVVDVHGSQEESRGNSSELFWASFDYFLHYDFSFWGRVDITPSATIGYDYLSLDLDSYGHSSFDVTVKPALAFNIYRSKGRTRGSGVYLTAKCGYVLPVYSGKWKIDDGSPAQALPEISMKGMFVHVGIGWSAWGL